MYAIIRSGGKQFRVETGNEIRVDLLPNEPGSAFETDQVLLTNDGSTTRIGKPMVEGALVKGTVIDHIKDKKIIVFKMKRRKGYRRTQGHRQQYTRIKIDSIQA
ncbi:MAG: 50S ribosomal protein L21 [SAR324 cluster bacterium]|nr:50S ribosomal protein L21 [SAR324 cluster bacterium]